MLVEALRYAILFEWYDLAVQLWKKFHFYACMEPKNIVETLVGAIEESIDKLEFKYYFFINLLHYLNEGHFNRILNSIERVYRV